MLYVSTRDERNTYTAYHALTESRAADGGHYVPFHWPKPVWEEEKPLNQLTAKILNQLFQTQLSKWDVDFAAGRYPVRMAPISRRVTVVESWHNVDWNVSRTVKNLAAQMQGTQDAAVPYGEWVDIAVRIAVLAGAVMEQLRSDGGETVDVALPSGDLGGVMAAWYARAWGLPIGTIVCCCNENNNLWELISHGILRTDATAVDTSTPECDQVVPTHLERLISVCGGREETERFLTCWRQGRTYYPDEETLAQMRRGLHVSVVSQSRMLSTIPNVYTTCGYVLGPYSALCYAGLMDYHAKTGRGGHALVVSEQGALCSDALVASALGIPALQLHRMLQSE